MSSQTPTKELRPNDLEDIIGLPRPMLATLPGGKVLHAFHCRGSWRERLADPREPRFVSSCGKVFKEVAEVTPTRENLEERKGEGLIICGTCSHGDNLDRIIAIHEEQQMREQEEACLKAVREERLKLLHGILRSKDLRLFAESSQLPSAIFNLKGEFYELRYLPLDDLKERLERLELKLIVK